MRDEILLSKDSYAESISKVLHDNLDDEDISTVTKMMIITVMSVWKFGTEDD